MVYIMQAKLYTASIMGDHANIKDMVGLPVMHHTTLLLGLVPMWNNWQSDHVIRLEQTLRSVVTAPWTATFD